MDRNEVWNELLAAVKNHKTYDRTVDLGNGFELNVSYRFIDNYEGVTISDCYIYYCPAGTIYNKKMWSRKSHHYQGDIPQQQIKTMINSVEKYLKKQEAEQ